MDIYNLWNCFDEQRNIKEIAVLRSRKYKTEFWRDYLINESLEGRLLRRCGTRREITCVDITGETGPLRQEIDILWSLEIGIAVVWFPIVF
ncbi:hypothetical protein J6590_068231 [Homalodisca vitripennis]|nr:hypothetical protein J6590_068231 [Homalodisca vitripennis]